MIFDLRTNEIRWLLSIYYISRVESSVWLRIKLRIEYSDINEMIKRLLPFG